MGRFGLGVWDQDRVNNKNEAFYSGVEPKQHVAMIYQTHNIEN